MIQRIQSIFLLLTAVAFGLLFQFPFAISDIANEGFLVDKDFDVFDHVALMVLAGLGGGLALISIFLFKNRKLQIRTIYLSVIMGILVLVVAVVLFYNEAFIIFEEAAIHDSFGLYLPIIGFVLGLLAARFIRKDDKIVKSMDRLR